LFGSGIPGFRQPPGEPVFGQALSRSQRRRDMPCANKTCLPSIVELEPTGLAKSRRSQAFSVCYWVALAIWCNERRRQRKALLQLDDRMLADIGISKAQAVEEAEKPFWK
jgi:uncharacterized protein YjiS (DUF1127 family)